MPKAYALNMRNKSWIKQQKPDYVKPDRGNGSHQTGIELSLTEKTMDPRSSASQPIGDREQVTMFVYISRRRPSKKSNFCCHLSKWKIMPILRFFFIYIYTLSQILLCNYFYVRFMNMYPFFAQLNELMHVK